MLLKMNRCSVTRRCLLGENEKEKKIREDAALSLELQFSGQTGEWYYERLTKKAGLTDRIYVGISGAQADINVCNMAKSSKCKNTGSSWRYALIQYCLDRERR